MFPRIGVCIGLTAMVLLSSLRCASMLAQLVTITATGSPSAGQTYTLMCVGSLVGNTSITPVVSWKNSNGVITNGGGIIVSGGNLTFNPIRTSYGGQYICQSTLDPPLNSTALASMNIVVQVPPPTVTITSTPITTSYYAGTPFNLTCTVQLNPQVDTNVTVTPVWFRGGSSIITIDNYTTISPMIGSSSFVTTLIFNPLGADDSGWYNCNVSVQPGTPYVISGVGGGSLVLSLQVLALPAPNVIITRSLPPPSLGVAYSLTCQAMGVAGLVLPIALTWTRADGLSLGSNGTLLLAPLAMSDLTLYTCTAVISLPYKGIYSVGSAAADVAVRTPGVVSGPALATPSDSSFVISWRPPQLSNGRLTGYALSIVQLLDYGMPVSGSAINATVDVIMTSYDWSGLYSGVPYQTCISAVNPLGPGDPWCKVFFTVERVPSVAPMGVVVTRSSDGLSMNISWSPLTLSQARGFVDYYAISYGPVGDSTRQLLKTTETYIVVFSLNVRTSYLVTVGGHTAAGLGPTIPVTSLPLAGPSVAPGSSMVTGAIAGAVIGGILSVLQVVAVILIIVTLRSKRKGRLSITINSLDTSIKSGKSQDKELTSINADATFHVIT